MSSSAVHRYRAFGLSLLSEVELPELALANAPADVRIVRAAIAEPSSRGGLEKIAGGALLNLPGVARFRISGGAEIVVEPDIAASARNVRLYLLGSAMGVLLHQRALLPLHANAVVIEGRAVAFSGHQGAGKSTLADYLHGQGLALLTDDVCVVDVTSDGTARAWAGIPRLRLWKDALERSGRAAVDHARSYDDYDKFDVPVTSEVPVAPVPLAAVYLLRRSDDGAAEVIARRLTGAEAVAALVSNTYRGEYVARVGDPALHLLQCTRLAERIAVFELTRPWNTARIERTNAAIVARVREDLARLAPQPRSVSASVLRK
jgi:hypothetical protein